MTEEEAQQALDQQTPVMRRGVCCWWRGPYLLDRVVEVQWSRIRQFVLSGGSRGLAAAHELRLATPHELLTAEDDG